MMSSRQLLSDEWLDRLFPAHNFFQILDRSIFLRPGELLIGPSDRFLIICVEANDEWSAVFAEHCTDEFTGELHLPDSLVHLTGATWLTGPDLATYLGISFPATDVAVFGNYVYISFHVGA